MTYLIQNKRNKGLSTFLTSGLFIFFIILFLVATLFFSFFNIFFIQTSSLLNNFYFVEYFRTKKSILAENKVLKDEREKLIADNVNHRALEEENYRLNELLNRVNIADSIVAKVIQKPGFSPYDVVVVDAGQVQGVEVGNIVFYESLALGTVLEVSENVSKIRLFSSPDNVFRALIGAAEYEVEAKGLGGGGFEVLIPVGIEVTEGDVVVLPEISTKVFGVVSSIKKEPGDVFQVVNFGLPVSPFAIDFVEIRK